MTTGRALLVCRLAARDVRRHRTEAGLLLLAIAAATTTLTLGLTLHGVTSQPYQRTRVATAGPDVVASFLNVGPLPPGGGLPDALRALKRLTRAHGVTGHTGPYPFAWPTLKVRGLTVGVMAEGRDPTQATIDQPSVTQGGWVSAGGAVVEQGYADSLGIHVGDHMSLGHRAFRVVGIALTAALPAYPSVEIGSGGSPFIHPGLIWLTRADARSLATASLPLSYIMNLRLARPDAAPAFVRAHVNEPFWLTSWQGILQQDARLIGIEQQVLLVGSWLLCLLAVASVAVLVGGRMAEQTKRVGLLKAVGATPGLIAAVLLAEDVALAVLAAAVGLTAGWLAAPLLTDPGAGLIGTASAPSLTLSRVGVVTAVALAVAIFATLVPALRAARTSTIGALTDSSRSPRRTARLTALSTRLPVPFLIGTRLAARRPRRTVLSGLSIAITVTTIVAFLAVRAHRPPTGHAGFSPLSNPRLDRINQVLFVLAIVLVLLASVNAIFVALATALDARRALAVARALGATPGQVSMGLSVSQLIPALPGTLLGIPAGVGLVSAVSNGGATPIPSAWSLIAVLFGTMFVMAGLTAIPARINAQRGVALSLQSEPA